MSRTLSVLAATLAVAAGAGCSDDGGGEEAAGIAAQATTAETTTAATTEAEATTAEPTEPAETTEPVETDPTEATETRPEPPQDQGRWAQQVDAACKPWQERIDAVAPPTDAATLEAFLADVIPLTRKQVAAVAAVKPPADEEAARQTTLFVAALRDLEGNLTRYLVAIRANDAEEIQAALGAASAAGVQARGYAAQLDVTECGGYESG